MSNTPNPTPLLKIARTPAFCLAPETSIQDAARQMVDTGVGAAAVVEDNKLIGILTERDLLVKVTAAGVNPEKTLVKDQMSTDVHTVRPDATRRAAASTMMDQHCRHLPITEEDGTVLGMLSIRHLHRDQLRKLKYEVQSLESYIGADGPGG